MVASRQSHTLTPADAVRRIRDLTGLPMETIADVLGVTRVTLYRWLDGKPIHPQHLEVLLAVLWQLDRAAERIGWGTSLRTWLLTPTTENTCPLDYLREHRYQVFRGFVLHVQPPGWQRPVLSDTDLTERLNRLSPRPFSEDYEC